MKQFKYITLIDEKETEEAKEYLKAMKFKYIWFPLTPFILAVIFTICVLSSLNNGNLIPIFAVCVFVMLGLTLLMLIVYFCKLSPYYKLLSVAKHNDKVRHDEKIRFNERQRLEKEHDTYTKKDIIKTVNSDL